MSEFDKVGAQILIGDRSSFDGRTAIIRLAAVPEIRPCAHEPITKRPVAGLYPAVRRIQRTKIVGELALDIGPADQLFIAQAKYPLQLIAENAAG